MRNVFLFCNLGYGLALLKAFMESAKCHKGVQHTVVLSSRNISSLRKRVFYFLRMNRKFIFHRSVCNIKIVRNVNSASFINSIPPGSIGVIAGFNQIFGRKAIDRFDELVNFHPSILPFYRGAIPSYWVIHNGEKRSGFTMHHVSIEIDAGPILFQEYIDVMANEDEESLDRRISERAAHSMRLYLNTILSNEVFETMTLPSPYENPVNIVPSDRPLS